MSFAYFNCFGRAYDRRRARIRSLALAQDHLPSPGVTASLLPPTARPQLSVPGAFRPGAELAPQPLHVTHPQRIPGAAAFPTPRPTPTPAAMTLLAAGVLFSKPESIVRATGQSDL
jgi:hypothetical protein